jgi:hypothetical protein
MENNVKSIKGKLVKIHHPCLICINFYGLESIPAFGKHNEPINEGENKFQNLNPFFIHWPVTFFFCGIRYTPDFYDPKTNTFYEIIGTAGRYYQGQNKMLRARRQIGVKIILCNPKGERFIPRYTKRGKSKLITDLLTIGKYPISDFYQDDYGKTSYSGIKKIIDDQLEEAEPIKSTAYYAERGEW